MSRTGVGGRLPVERGSLSPALEPESGRINLDMIWRFRTGATLSASSGPHL
jgi:hypothetical protein